jgi:hypothetical protein
VGHGRIRGQGTGDRRQETDCRERPPWRSQWCEWALPSVDSPKIETLRKAGNAAKPRRTI